MHKLKNIVVLLLVATTLGGCAVRVAYHFLDVAMLWSLDDYIDFEGDQRREAKVAIKDFHRWHRYVELPVYAVNFDALANDLEEPVTVETIDNYGQLLLAGWDNIMQALVTPSVDILSQLSDKQVQEMLETLAEAEQEDREDYDEQTTEDVLEERYDFMADAAKKLAGSLNEQQQTMIKDWAASLRNMGDMSLDHRSQWREQFANALQDRADKAQLELNLTALYTDPYQFWSESYRENMTYNEALTHQLLADLANSMTDKQRKRAVKRLRAIAGDFRTLSKQKES